LRILDSVFSHADLIGLDQEQRATLCGEIREFLVQSLSKTGGHLASNLGVVELTVALETVFDSNIDRLVFDVGHQSYVHKLLTGRQADFARLRQFGGIAGFPKPSESQSDAFVAGHASSSISIALGMARARTLLGHDYDVVAIIGDGAATGGMVYEALNDVAVSKEPMIIILNDNEMSIAPNVGGFAQHLSRLRTKEGYLGLKQIYRSALSKTAFTRMLYRASSRVKGWMKRILLPATIFENMGLTYFGPVDGNDTESLITLLRQARDLRSPVLIHVTTKKGKGYAPAEQMPSKFHGVGPFDPETGVMEKKGHITFSQAFGETMVELAREDDRICAITAAMPDGTGLAKFQQDFPKRTFDVGICEEHAVSMAGGLAKQGMKPVLALYSTFLQRSYDQILQDIAMLKLPVVLAVDRAGLVGEDGETHHGVFDVGFLRHAPGMKILAPACCEELKTMLRSAVKDCDGPVAIRYPRGGDGAYQTVAWDGEHSLIEHRIGDDAAIITYGTLINNALEAAVLLREDGIWVKVIRLTKLSPLDFNEIEEVLRSVQSVFVVEETHCDAGICGAIAAAFPGKHVRGINLGCDYISHGSVSELYQKHGLDAASIRSTIREVSIHGT
jgi:1-deoxy-D-xylulose-5-phosphate synthase